MSPRTSAWLAWSLSAAFVLLSVPLYWSTSPSAVLLSVPQIVAVLTLAALVLAFSSVGALIVARRPGNRIGWILCAAGLTIGATTLASGYAVFSLAGPSRLPGTEWAAWIAYWIWVPGVGPAMTFGLLLFPDGRLPSRRWRVVGWLSMVALATLAFGSAFTPGPLSDYPEVNNPLGLAPLEGSVLEDGGVGWVLLPASVVISAVSIAVRYRRATGEQRQQIKWFVFAGVLIAVGWAASLVAQDATSDSGGLLVVVSLLLGITSLLGIPVAVGIAILRHRLYDIDLIINRTLVYGALTAMLALVYLGGVVLLQQAFRALTGHESQLAVVASTLTIAALFNPLRRRIQSFIDRRFYRRKYDAAKTLEAFSARLREEPDLDRLGKDLGDVVTETLQPEHVSLLLRPDTEPRDNMKKRAPIREAGHD
jgi:hypothetical protein